MTMLAVVTTFLGRRTAGGGSSRRALAAAFVVGMICAWPSATPAQTDPRDAMLASTVRIINISGKATGSGVIIGAGRHVGTNWHVVDNGAGGASTQIVVAQIIGDQVKMSEGRVVWAATPRERDVAILEIVNPLGPPALGDLLDVRVADRVLAVGFPGVSDDRLPQREGNTIPREFFEPTVTTGSVARVLGSSSNTYGRGRLILHQVPLNPGNSGGPLFDECGALVGLNTRASEAQGTNVTMHVSELEIGMQELNLPVKRLTRCDGVARPGASSATSWLGWILLWLTVGATFVLAGTAMVIALVRGRARARTQFGQGTTPRPGPQPSPVPVVPPGPPPLPPGRHDPFAGQGASARQGRLRCLAGELAGRDVTLGHETLLFGRDPSLPGLVFIGESSASVSKRHCQLQYDPEQRLFYLTDLGSSNGTFLGTDERLTPRVRYTLRSGDRFYLASRATLFEVSTV